MTIKSGLIDQLCILISRTNKMFCVYQILLLIGKFTSSINLWPTKVIHAVVQRDLKINLMKIFLRQNWKKLSLLNRKKLFALLLLIETVMFKWWISKKATYYSCVFGLSLVETFGILKKIGRRKRKEDILYEDEKNQKSRHRLAS